MESPRTCPLLLAAIINDDLANEKICQGKTDCHQSSCAWWSEARQDCRILQPELAPKMETKVDLHENYSALDQAADRLEDPRD